MALTRPTWYSLDLYAMVCSHRIDERLDQHWN